MRPLLIACLTLLAACATSSGRGSATGDGQFVVPPVPKAMPADGRRAFEIADLYRLATVGAPALAPDGQRIAFSVKRFELEAGKTWSEIWIVRRDGSGLRQLTTGRHNDTGPSFSPDGRALLFVSDREKGSQLWLLPLDGGDPHALTEFKPGLADPVWSPDGRWIAATSDLWPECGLDQDCHEKIRKGLEDGKTKVHVADELLYRHWNAWSDGKRTHVVLVDASSGKVERDLTPGQWDAPTFELGGGRGFVFSPDSKELCFVSNHDAEQARSTNADLWVVPVAGGDARNLTAGNKGWDGEPLYSPDGRWIGFISQATPAYESDLRRLAVLERATGRVHYLTERGGFDDWVGDLRWRADAKSLVIQADNRGRTPLYEIAVDGGKPREVLRHGTLGGFELAQDGAIVYQRRTVGEPAELCVLDAPGGAPRRLTATNAAVEKDVDIRPACEFEVAGEASYAIHGFLVTPHGFDPAQRYPLILNVHGGPQSQWTDALRGDWQVYPGQGYIVAFCNPTGSTGYGQDLTDAIRGDYGGRVYRDLMRVTDALATLPYVDKDRMGVMGWSYGGYMSMWMEGQTDRFQCNAAMMGIFDLRAFWGATEELWFPEHDLNGTPWTSKEYERWSPCNYAENFKMPALVITGELDYRCPYTQSLAYYTALKERNVPARLVVLPNAGHWPAWHEMAFYYNVHLDFFHQWLGGGAAPWKVEEHARNLAFGKR